MLQLVHRRFSNRFFSKGTNRNPASSSFWRLRKQECLLVSQISSILLQRHNWTSLLSAFNLSSAVTPSLFLQVLHKIQNHPQISLDFFNWSKSSLGFQPDLKTQIEMTRILVGSENSRKVKPVLDSMVEDHPPALIVDSLLQACKNSAMEPTVLSSIIQFYVRKGSYFDSLEAYIRIVLNGFVPETGCCNALLDGLGSASEFRLAWCLYGSIIRNNVLLNSNSWSVMARILSKNGKPGRVVKLLESGICSPVIFNIAIECHSKSGNFGAALDCLNDMRSRKFEPGVGTYSSILNGASKYEDASIMELIIKMMTERKFIPELLGSKDYNSCIKVFCELGHTYAAERLFKKAMDRNLELKEATFGCMLRAFARGGRTKEAIDLYNRISEKQIMVSQTHLQAFGDALCKDIPSIEANNLLIALISLGVSPCVSKLSAYIMTLCRNRRWEEAEGLLNLILGKGLLLSDLSCCRLLVMNYCSRGQVNSALLLHERLVGLGLVLDAKAYNELLRKLFEAKRVDDAVRVFEYMRKNNMTSRASFIIMISGLSSEKDIRGAMRVHDQMLELGMKPSPRMYRNLISVFA